MTELGYTISAKSYWEPGGKVVMVIVAPNKDTLTIMCKEEDTFPRKESTYLIIKDFVRRHIESVQR